MSKSIPFIDLLNENLKDPIEASLYLNEVIALGDIKALLVALRDVVDARGGIKSLADASGLHPKTLYRTLSLEGNPRLETLALILSFSGLSISVNPDTKMVIKYKERPKYHSISRAIATRAFEQIDQPRERNEWFQRPVPAYG